MGFRKTKEPSPAEIALSEALEELTWRIKIYKLDPELPELISLPDRLRDASKNEHNLLSLAWAVRDVDPWDTCNVGNDGVVTIQEKWIGARMLTPWSLIRHHLSDFDIEGIWRIHVNKDGTHVFSDVDAGNRLGADGYPTRPKLVGRYFGGVCNPHRLADTGNRLNNAALLIQNFTDLEVDMHDLAGKYSVDARRKDNGNEWEFTYSEDRATRRFEVSLAE